MSVVIPAYNEAAVITRCLDQLADVARTGEVEVIVACNGCVDDTAAIAKGYEGVALVDLAEASKAAALRAAEELTTALPRVFLDADVELTAGALRTIVATLDTSSVRTARPPIKYVTDRSSWLVGQYYFARTRLPSVLNSLWGAGVYALNAAARSRFDQFPDLVADDLWIDNLFDRSEIVIVDCDAVLVRAPRRSADLLRILRRGQLGKADIKGASGLARSEQTTSSVRVELRKLAGTGWRGAVAALVYAGFAVAARATRTTKSTTEWERDESSRQC